MISLKRIITLLGVAGSVLLVAVLLWFGHDLWSTFRRGWNEGLAPAEFNVQQARALKHAQDRRVKGPEYIYVKVLPEREDRVVRERHGVTPSPSPVSPLPPSPVAVGEPAQPDYPLLLDMKDLFVEKCGDTFEVACWLFADGSGKVTVVERPRTVVEKGVDAVSGGLRALHGWPHTVEVGGEVDLERTSDWQAWLAYEPFYLGHTRPRVKVEWGSVDGVEDVKVYGGVVARFDLGK